MTQTQRVNDNAPRVTRNATATRTTNEKEMTMTARTRTRKPAVKLDIDVTDEPNIIESDDVVLDTPADAPVATTARKYFSHANCIHARKGEAGKVARATCRRDIRAWLNAEKEFNNTDELLAV